MTEPSSVRAADEVTRWDDEADVVVVGLGAARDNDRAEAAELSRRVLALMPADAPDRALVRRKLDALGAGE